MGSVKKLLAERKWAFVLIFFVLLFNPVFYFWADNISAKDKNMAWITCIVVALAMCCIDLFVKKKGEKIFLGIFYLLSLVPNLIVWSYLFVSHLCMKRDMFWVIFTTHKTESQEFLHEFVTWQMCVAATIYVVVGILCWVKTHSTQSLSLKKYWPLFSFSVALVLLSIILQYLVQAIPAFDFYKSRVLYWRENIIFQQEKEFRKSLKMDVQCALPDSINHTFVVLLGESASACHMSLYGYFRETTPLMDAQKDELEVYTDVVTPDTHTFGVMQKVLTFGNHEHPEYFRQKPSMVEMLKSAGFETYWISNKAFLTKWGGSYGIIAEEADHLYDLSALQQKDEIVIPSLQKALADTIQKNKIIFIHVMGNHHAYNCRYPQQYSYFDHKTRNDLPDLGFRTGHMKQVIDEYDNSIRYGDYVYSQVLEELKKQNTSSFLLFFSDHGDEVYDYRDAAGHFMSNVYPSQCKIPFVLWRSDTYKEIMPNLAIDTSRAYSIENVIYSLSTLCDLKYADNEQELSIFSPEYKTPAKRLVGKENYEDILKKNLVSVHK